MTKEIHDQIKKNLKTLERLTGLSMMLDEWEVRYEKIKNKSDKEVLKYSEELDEEIAGLKQDLRRK